MTWTIIPNSQTPAWALIDDSEVIGGAFEADAFQNNAFQVGVSESAAWAIIANAQTPNWTIISDV